LNDATAVDILADRMIGLMREIRRIVIASGNQGKVEEFQQYFRRYFADGVVILPKPAELEIEETGATFLDNAKLKAYQTAIATEEWSLADDSGLEVMALGGAPGVKSARYADDDQARIARVLRELGDRSDRSARFVCALAMANPEGHIVYEAVGTCEGQITHAPRGEHGFGYDPIFLVPEYGQTFAEMPSELKHRISHRARALAILQAQWQSEL